MNTKKNILLLLLNISLNIFGAATTSELKRDKDEKNIRVVYVDLAIKIPDFLSEQLQKGGNQLEKSLNKSSKKLEDDNYILSSHNNIIFGKFIVKHNRWEDFIKVFDDVTKNKKLNLKIKKIKPSIIELSDIRYDIVKYPIEFITFTEETINDIKKIALELKCELIKEEILYGAENYNLNYFFPPIINIGYVTSNLIKTMDEMPVPGEEAFKLYCQNVFPEELFKLTEIPVNTFNLYYK